MTLNTGIRKEVGDMREIWQSILAILGGKVPKPSFRTWLEGTQLRDILVDEPKPTYGVGSATVVISVPSIFAAEWLRCHYKNIIAETLKAFLNYSIKVSFRVEPKEPHRAIRALDGIRPSKLSRGVGAHSQIAIHGCSERSASLLTGDPVKAQGSHVQVRESSPSPTDSAAYFSAVTSHYSAVDLNPHYTFERFLIGRGNEAGVSAAQQFVEEPDPGGNLLFLYGPKGAGKTHLLHSIGNYALAKAGTHVLAIPATSFRQEAESLTPNNLDRISCIDLLLVDDLQDILGVSGRAAQQALFLLMERLLAEGKRIAVAGSQAPGAVLTLRDNLCTLLREGKIAFVGSSDFELRVRMLRRIVQSAGQYVEQDALQLMATSVDTISDLTALWNCVAARCSNAQNERGCRQLTEAITKRDVELVLSDTGTDAMQEQGTSAEKIIEQVVAYFNLEPNEICGASREQRTLLARQIAMYLIREHTNYSYKWIANRFAKQDHTTAMYSCEKIGLLIRTNLELRQSLLELGQMIYGEHLHSIKTQPAS